MRIFRRPRDSNEATSETEFIWGVPRREGLSDTDDPQAHAGVMQHAFEFGRDDRAICGFEPPKRASRAYRDARAQLAVPNRDNPKCRKCELLVASRVRGDEAVAVMDPASRNGVPATSDLDAEAVAVEEPAEEGSAPRAAELIGLDAHAEAIATDELEPQAAATDGDETTAPEEQAHDEPAFTSDVAPEIQEAVDEAFGDETAGVVDQADKANALGETPDSAAAGVDSLRSARDPGFQPRAPAERVRRRSVRKGGTVIVGQGRRSVVVEFPVSNEIAGIVANVEPEVEGVRVEAVTASPDGTARVTLNKPAPDNVEIAWYIVSNPFRESA